MAMADDEAARLIDPAIAVDRALNASQRAVFTRNVLVGPNDGMTPADWIDEALNADAYLALVEAWLARYGEEGAASIARNLCGLPQQLARSLLRAALYAVIGVDGGETARRLEAVLPLARRATVWARGYAEGRGWTPDDN